jgi:hypothetical protein
MFMHAVLVIAVVIIAIVLERAIVISARASLNGRKLADDLVRAVGRGDLERRTRLGIRSKSPVSRVAQAMLQANVATRSISSTSADNCGDAVPAGPDQASSPPRRARELRHA